MAAKRIHFLIFCMHLSNFRMKIHESSVRGAKRYRDVAKIIPDVKITLFLQSGTWTCSELDFSSIFVEYSSRIFGDFQGFS